MNDRQCLNRLQGCQNKQHGDHNFQVNGVFRIPCKVIVNLFVRRMRALSRERKTYRRTHLAYQNAFEKQDEACANKLDGQN
jgi:hypothetical protein